MNGTCKEGCKFYKKRIQECPNYILTTWESNKGERTQVEDCSLVRMMLMNYEFDRRLNTIQQEIEKMRNQQEKFIEIIAVLMGLKGKEGKKDGISLITG